MSIRCRIRPPTASVAVVLLGFLLGACGGGDPNPTEPDPDPSISLSPTQAEILATDTTRVVATVLDIDNRAVTWSSGSPGVASVDADGLVRGNAPGTATITATLVASSSTRATATITVLDPCEVGVGGLEFPQVGDTYSAMGTLEAGDCDAGDETGLHDSWALELGSDAGLTLAVRDAEFAPVLELREAGSVILRSDQGGLGLSIAPGSYEVRVSSADGSAAGAYSLDVIQYDRCDARTARLEPGGTLEQAVTGIDCPLPGGFRADLIEFELAEPGNAIVQLGTSNWDGRLFLTSSASTNPLEGTPLGQAMDGAPDAGAALAVEGLAEGVYRIWVLEEEPGARGPYELGLETGAFGRVSLGEAAPVSVMLGGSPIVDLDIELVPGNGGALEISELEILLQIPDQLVTTNGWLWQNGNSEFIPRSFVPTVDPTRPGRVLVVERSDNFTVDGSIGLHKIVTIGEGQGPIRARVLQALDRDGNDVTSRIVGGNLDLEVASVPESAIRPLGPGENVTLDRLEAGSVFYFEFSNPAAEGGSSASLMIAEGHPGASNASADHPEKLDWHPTTPEIAAVVFDIVSVSTTTDDSDADADLYLRRGALPTYDRYDCRSFSATSQESCSLIRAGSNERWFGMVRLWDFRGVDNLSIEFGSTTQVDGANQLAWASGFADGSIYAARGAGGADVHMRRLDTGFYEVIFEDFGVPPELGFAGAEAVLANQAGIPSVGEVVVCGPERWAEGQVLLVEVRCADEHGVSQDSPFHVVAVGGGSFEGPSAFFFAAGGFPSYSQARGPLFWNDTGELLTVSPGVHDRRIEYGTGDEAGAAFFAGIRGPDRVGRCAIAEKSAAPAAIELSCRNAAGESITAEASTVMVGSGPRADGEAHGWVIVEDPSQSGSVPPPSSFNSSGGPVTVEPYETGLWRVGFEGHAGVGAIVAIATILGDDGGKCHNELSLEDGESGEAVVFVRCYDADNQPASRPFNLVFLR